jgi:hypothetical protein
MNYITSILKPETLACIQKGAAQCTTNPQLLCMALGRAIAAKLPLPGEEVKSATEFFESMCNSQARSLISAMSDALTFGVDDMLTSVKLFWMIRYKAAYPSSLIHDSIGCCSESTFLGYGSVVSAAEVKFIQDNTAALICAFNNFSKVICEMCEYKQAQESKGV